MGVEGIRPLSGKPRGSARRIEQVVAAAHAVSAFQQHSSVIGFGQLSGCLLHLRRRSDACSGQLFCFRQIGSQQFRQRKQLFRQRLLCLLFQQRVTAGGNHDRIHHHMGQLILCHCFCNGENLRRIIHHAHFDGSRRNVLTDRCDLLL